jgi:hypothetical protein
MKVVGLNNKEYNLSLPKYLKNKEHQNKSSFHLKARNLLFECFPSYTIYEEIKLPGSTNPKNKSVLFLDFFIPSLKIGIEVHGRQHFEYIPYFHKNKLGFYNHLYRDNLKQEWCEKNEIKLIILKYNEVDLWRMQLECC